LYYTTLLIIGLLFSIITTAANGHSYIFESQPTIKMGVDVLIEVLKVGIEKGKAYSKFADCLSNKRVGLVTNQTGRTQQGISTQCALEPLLNLYGSTVTALFALEHGVKGNIEARAAVTNSSDLKIKAQAQSFSLYGEQDETLYPSPDMLDAVNVIVYDIADVGTRCYTYASSLYYIIQKVKERSVNNPDLNNIKIIVLDHPNPISGKLIDGPLVEQQWRSFIGVFALPVCHGMTIGELALMYDRHTSDLANQSEPCVTVIPLHGWQREQALTLREISWMPSSPNMASLEATHLYPITVIAEGLTFLTSGKGTPQAFQYLAAPGINGKHWALAANKLLHQLNLKGVRIIEHVVVPSAGNFTGTVCEGVRIEVTDSLAYKPVAIQYVLLEALQNTHTDFLKNALQELKLKRDKAVRVHQGLALSDYHQACWLMGTESVLDDLLNNQFKAQTAIEIYTTELESFRKIRKTFLMY
jgi:uncharacterized protein YbbC (DUF1343 family)